MDKTDDISNLKARIERLEKEVAALKAKHQSKQERDVEREDDTDYYYFSDF